MKTLNLFALLIVTTFSTYAAAATNQCTFGGSRSGAVHYPFQRIEPANPMSRRYYAVRLGEDLTATVSRIQGHSAQYILEVNYKNSEMTVRDQYIDFAPTRLVHVSGSVKGTQFYCEFDPQAF